MNLFTREGMVFVDLGNGYMLCIGTKEVIDKANDKQIIEMFEYALAYSQYRDIESSRRQAVM